MLEGGLSTKDAERFTGILEDTKSLVEGSKRLVNGSNILVEGS